MVYKVQWTHPQACKLCLHHWEQVATPVRTEVVHETQYEALILLCVCQNQLSYLAPSAHGYNPLLLIGINVIFKISYFLTKKIIELT